MSIVRVLSRSNMATRLSELELNEMSGVEHPANELPGFMVLKSKAQELPEGERAELLKEVDRMESDFAVLYSSLNATQQYMGDAPPEVQQAAQTLLQYVESLFNDQNTDTTPDAGADAAAAQQPLAASKKPGESLIKRMLRRGKLDEEETDPVEKNKETEEKPEVEKSETPELSADVAKALADTATALEQLNETVTKLDGAVKELGEGQDVVKQAMDATLDRVGALEVQKQADQEYDITPPTTVDKSADPTARASAALRSVLVDVARTPGTRHTIG